MKSFTVNIPKTRKIFFFGLVFSLWAFQSVYSQNVGITDASSITPNYLLQLHKNSSGATSFLQFTNTLGGIGTTATDGFTFDVDGSFNLSLNNREATSLGFNTTGATRMTISSNGYVGINTTPSSSYQLDVFANSNTAFRGYYSSNIYGYVGTSTTGVFGISNNASGAGVIGNGGTATDGVWGTCAYPTNGYAGVRGDNSDANGDGVYGYNSAAAGNGTGSGVFAYTSQGGDGSTQTAGVWGVLNYNTPLSGCGIGGFLGGSGASGFNSVAISGIVGSTVTTASTGVYGAAFNTSVAGRGVAGYFGSSPASSFSNCGVSGISSSAITGGLGVIGKCDNATGIGVQGQSAGATGTGVFGIAQNTAAGSAETGVYGEADGGTAGNGGVNMGVEGYGSGGSSNFGLYSDASLGVAEYNGGALAAGTTYEISGTTAGYIYFASSGAGTTYIHGISGGFNGKILYVYYAGTINLQIFNNSTLYEATPANRILTNTGADVVSTNACMATFIYSSVASRWILISWLP